MARDIVVIILKY